MQVESSRPPSLRLPIPNSNLLLSFKQRVGIIVKVLTSVSVGSGEVRNRDALPSNLFSIVWGQSSGVFSVMAGYALSFGNNRTSKVPKKKAQSREYRQHCVHYVSRFASPGSKNTWLPSGPFSSRF